MLRGTVPVPATFRDVHELLDHAAYYFPAERAAAFNFLSSGGATITLARVLAGKRRRTLKSCATLLVKANIRVAIVDVTSAEVARTPFHVFRAVSPDLQPISFGYGFERQPVARVIARGVAADAPPIHPVW
jgi:ribosomal protein S12 methylthiotransferase accessory factor